MPHAFSYRVQPGAAGRLAALLAVIIVAGVLAGCEITIGPLPTPTPGGAPSLTPQVVIELTPVASPTLSPPTATAGVPGKATTYIVQAGDSLSGIAAKFGLTVDDIVKANNIENANQIYAGQELIIPATSKAPATTPKP